MKRLRVAHVLALPLAILVASPVWAAGAVAGGPGATPNERSYATEEVTFTNAG